MDKTIYINSTGQNPNDFQVRIPNMTIPPDTEIALIDGKMSVDNMIVVDETNDTFMIYWGNFDQESETTFTGQNGADYVGFVPPELIKIPHGAYYKNTKGNDTAGDIPSSGSQSSSLYGALVEALNNQTHYPNWGWYGVGANNANIPRDVGSIVAFWTLPNHEPPTLRFHHNQKGFLNNIVEYKDDGFDPSTTFATFGITEAFKDLLNTDPTAVSNCIFVSQENLSPVMSQDLVPNNQLSSNITINDGPFLCKWLMEDLEVTTADNQFDLLCGGVGNTTRFDYRYSVNRSYDPNKDFITLPYYTNENGINIVDYEKLKSEGNRPKFDGVKPNSDAYWYVKADGIIVFGFNIPAETSKNNKAQRVEVETTTVISDDIEIMLKGNIVNNQQTGAKTTAYRWEWWINDTDAGTESKELEHFFGLHTYEDDKPDNLTYLHPNGYKAWGACQVESTGNDDQQPILTMAGLFFPEPQQDKLTNPDLEDLSNSFDSRYGSRDASSTLSQGRLQRLLDYRASNTTPIASFINLNVTLIFNNVKRNANFLTNPNDPIPESIIKLSEKCNLDAFHSENDDLPFVFVNGNINGLVGAPFNETAVRLQTNDGIVGGFHICLRNLPIENVLANPIRGDKAGVLHTSFELPEEGTNEVILVTPNNNIYSPILNTNPINLQHLHIQILDLNGEVYDGFNATTHFVVHLRSNQYKQMNRMLKAMASKQPQINDEVQIKIMNDRRLRQSY